MKFLLLFLITLSAQAQHRIYFNPIDENQANQFVQEDTVEAVKEKAKEVLNRSKSIKGSWVKDSESIIQRTSTDLDGNEFVEGFESTSHTFSIEDVSQEVAAQEAMKNLNKAISCGSNIVKLITIRNSQKGLTSTQFLEILQTYKDSKGLMESGALQSAKDLIQTLTPDGFKVTEEDKAFVIGKLDECLQ